MGDFRPLDRTAAIEFPIRETEDDDIGDPDLQRSQKKLVAVVGRALDKGANQQDKRDEISDSNDDDQREGQCS